MLLGIFMKSGRSTTIKASAYGDVIFLFSLETRVNSSNRILYP